MIQSLKHSISGITAALILAGCVTVGPDYQAPATFNASAVETANTVMINNEWWQQFNDPTLDQLITIASERNPSVAIAQANLARALAVFDDVEDNDWPTGSMDAAYTAQRQIVPGASDERVSIRTRQLGLSAGWEIDLVGKLHRAEEAANADAEAAYFAWQEAQLTLLSNVARTYIELRGIQTRVSVAENTLSSLLKTQDVVISQVEAGFATRLDELRVRSEVARVEAELPALHAAARATQLTLTALVGGEQYISAIDFANQPIPALSSPVPLQASNGFLQKRPDVRAAERRLASATAQIGVATGDLYPSLSLNGFLGFVSTQGQVLSSHAEAWSIAPTMSWQVLDLDSVRARIRVADANQTASLAQFEQIVLQAIAETETALSNYAYFQRQLAAIEQQVTANQEALSLAQYQYQNGSIDLLNLLDVERQWLAAKDQQASVQTQMTTSLVNIYTAMGGGILKTS